MAKTKTAPAPATTAQEESSTRSRVTAVVVGVVVGLVLGGGAYVLLLERQAAPVEAIEVARPEEGEIVDVDELVVNVKGDGAHYARVGFAVVLSAETAPDAVAPDLPLLKDAAISEIGRFSDEQLRTPEGGDALRGALTARAHELWPRGEVLRVVLTSLVVQ